MRLLDLGCGTGLAGVALSDITHHRTGIDLSSRMVDIAGESDLYDELYVGDVVAFVQEIEDEAPWDLIVATDVLPYLGGVEELFAGVRRVSAPGAVFAFSTELLEGDGQTFTVGPHQRFHHAIAYLTRELEPPVLRSFTCRTSPSVMRKANRSPAIWSSLKFAE
jgi:predicted TPR repeat methyltransferase